MKKEHYKSEKVFACDSEEFKHYCNRAPKDQSEFEEWARLVWKWLEQQINWDVIYNCASEEIKQSC